MSNITQDNYLQEIDNKINSYKNQIDKLKCEISSIKRENIDYQSNIYQNPINQSKYNNYIRLKSLYKVKSFKKNFNKTEHNAKIMSIRPKNINKNYSQRQKQFDGIKNYGRKIIPKAYIYNLLNLYNNGKTDE